MRTAGLLIGILLWEIGVYAQGCFPVFCENGRICLEIEKGLLGKELMLTAQINRGFGLRNRFLETAAVFSLKAGSRNNLELYWSRWSERITDTSFLKQGLLESSGLRLPDQIWPVVCLLPQGRGFVVDITDGLLRGEEWYVCKNDKLRGEKADCAELLSYRQFEGGVCFTVKRFYEVMPQYNVSEMVQGTGFLPVEISLALTVLPEERSVSVPACPGVPFRTKRYVDYGKNPFGILRDSLLVRWNTTCGNPLRICADREVPELYARLLEEEIETLNALLAEKGEGALLKFRKMADTADVLVPCLFSFDAGKNGIEACCLEHPVDGRILFARLNAGGCIDPALLLRYRLANAVAPARENGRMLMTQQEAEKAYIRELLAGGLRMMLGLDIGKCRKGRIGKADAEMVSVVYASQHSSVRQVVIKPDSLESIFGDVQRRAELYRDLAKVLERELYTGNVDDGGKQLLDAYRQLLLLAEENNLALIGGLEKSRNSELQQKALRWLYRELLAETEGKLASSFMKQNLLLLRKKEMTGRCRKIWQELFKTELWLEFYTGQTDNSAPAVMMQEIFSWYEKKQRTLPDWAEMTVQTCCIKEWAASFKVLKDECTVTEGIAGYLLLKEWNAFQSRLVALFGKQQRKTGREKLVFYYYDILSEQLD